MNSKLILLGILVLLTVFLIGCDGDNTHPVEVQQKTDAGVVVRGYSCDGYIKNTNSFPVRIREVWQYSGEKTKWVKIFEPGEKKEQFISCQHGFYIMDMDGKLIGFILVRNN